MILADTSVWIDHLRHGEPRLEALLEAGEIAMHPHVRGEIALGSLRNRPAILRALTELPQAMTADEEEVTAFVEAHSLWGQGIGWVDAHLLAATLLTHGTRLWTRDRRLSEIAQRLGVAPEAME